jgi:spermidine/putrescine-binding protein
MSNFVEDGALEDAERGAGVRHVEPINFKLAFGEMRKLGSNLQFTSSLDQASQLLTSGNAVMVQTAAGRILPLEREGLHVGFTAIGIRSPDFWEIPKGAKDKAQAEAFLSFIASCTPCSSELARLTAYAGPNARGDRSAGASAAYLPSNPRVEKSTWAPNLAYWSKHATEITDRFTAFVNS